MAAVGEASYRRITAELWVLLRTAGSAGSPAAVAAAAASLAAVLGGVLADETHFVLQERQGALFCNGMRIRPDVASFAAIAGVTALMQEHGVEELMLMPAARAADLERLARGWSDPVAVADLERNLASQGCQGVIVTQSGAAAAPAPQSCAAPSAPSQLGAVFTMQQFAAALEPMGPLTDHRARLILQSVLDRLLHSRAGLEPLARVQRDPVAHAEAVRACVLAVRTAGELAWPEDRGTAAGVAALLGPAAASDGDAEVADLARAARAVASLLAADADPAAAVDSLVLHGQLAAGVADAMLDALAAPQPQPARNAASRR